MANWRVRDVIKYILNKYIFYYIPYLIFLIRPLWEGGDGVRERRGVLGISFNTYGQYGGERLDML